MAPTIKVHMEIIIVVGRSLAVSDKRRKATDKNRDSENKRNNGTGADAVRLQIEECPSGVT